jgi:hypothetical protein
MRVPHRAVRARSSPLRSLATSTISDPVNYNRSRLLVAVAYLLEPDLLDIDRRHKHLFIKSYDYVAGRRFARRPRPTAIEDTLVPA